MKRMTLYTTRPFEHNGEERTDWIRVGVAFPHRSGKGFSVQLHALPLDGKLVALEVEPKDTDRAE